MDCHKINEADKAKGAYVFRDAHMGMFDAIAAFDQPGELLRAADMLSVQGIVLRLVQVDDITLFEGQERDYREKVIRPGSTVIAITNGGDWPERIGANCLLGHLEAGELAMEIKGIIRGAK